MENKSLEVPFKKYIKKKKIVEEICNKIDKELSQKSCLDEFN